MSNTSCIAPICAFDVSPDGVVSRVSNYLLPAEPAEGQSYRWLHFDVTDPGLADWVHGHLPQVPGDALLQSETRPRCDRFEDGVILNLRGVNLNQGQASDDMVSLRVWATERLVVSARVRKVFAADALREEFEGGHAPKSVPGFLNRLIAGLTDRIEASSLSLDEHADEIEETVLEGRAVETLDLTAVRSSVIKFRRYIGPQREALSKLSALENSFLSGEDRVALRELANRATRTVEELDAVRDRLAAVQDYLDIQQSAKLSRNGYLLSVVAAIFLPLGFVTGLFGVNVAGIPGSDWPYAFALLSGLMATVAVLLLFLFKKSKWL